jgi:hypothetical protein
MLSSALSDEEIAKFTHLKVQDIERLRQENQ